VAEFTDANPLPPTGSSSVADFTATIDWGDGTPITAGTIVSVSTSATATYEVTGSHTYADAGVNGGTGTYTIQVFVVDDGGSKLTITNTATVTDNPLTVTGNINPKSVSGLSTGTPDVTNVSQPSFYGTVLATLPTDSTTPEAYAEVTLTATNTTTGTATVLGTVQAGSGGAWNLKSQVVLPDGHYSITATATDQFGVTDTTAPNTLVSDLLIDTVGPVIDGMYFNRLNGQVDYIIKDPVNPDGSAPSGVWVNTLLDSSNYLLTKVHANKAYPGKWVVTNVTATPDPTIPYAYDVAVTFNGGRPIQGGFYLFTIRDSSNGNSSVQDLAENHLDGVFYGTFPSGNGINGSDFIAELQAYHDKVFAPQSIIGSAAAANGGIGGVSGNGVHTGVFVPLLPRGASPIFSTSTSKSNGGDPPAVHKKSKGQIVVKHKGQSLVSDTHHKTKVLVKNSHPKGPKHA
jgi:large repetitive protein